MRNVCQQGIPVRPQWLDVQFGDGEAHDVFGVDVAGGDVGAVGEIMAAPMWTCGWATSLIPSGCQ